MRKRRFGEAKNTARAHFTVGFPFGAKFMGANLCRYTGPTFRRAPHLFQCSAFTVLKCLILFAPGSYILILRCPANYADSPGSDSLRKARAQNVGRL